MALLEEKVVPLLATLVSLAHEADINVAGLGELASGCL